VPPRISDGSRLSTVDGASSGGGAEVPSLDRIIAPNRGGIIDFIS